MSDITEAIAADHHFTWHEQMLEEVAGQCACGMYVVSHRIHAEHVAEVTEQAVRAQVAAELNRAALDAAGDFIQLRGNFSGAWVRRNPYAPRHYREAARITEQGEKQWTPTASAT